MAPIIKLKFNSNSNWNQSRKGPKIIFFNILRFNDFHGLQNDLKILSKNFLSKKFVYIRVSSAKLKQKSTKALGSIFSLACGSIIGYEAILTLYLVNICIIHIVLNFKMFTIYKIKAIKDFKNLLLISIEISIFNVPLNIFLFNN